MGHFAAASRGFSGLTSKMTYTCPRRGPCQRSEAEPARSVTRVGVRSIALFDLFSVCCSFFKEMHLSGLAVAVLVAVGVSINYLMLSEKAEF